jgi:hypothetical protein
MSSSTLAVYYVDARLLGPLLEVLVREVLLVREGQIVELPEGVATPDAEHRHAGVGGRARAIVEGERLVLPDHADLVRTVRVPDLLERRLDARTEGALVIADGDDGDGRRRLAPLRVLGSDGDGRVARIATLARCRERAWLGAEIGAGAPIDSVHQQHACHEAEQEADDCGSFVHDEISPRGPVRDR